MLIKFDSSYFKSLMLRAFFLCCLAMAIFSIVNAVPLTADNFVYNRTFAYTHFSEILDYVIDGDDMYVLNSGSTVISKHDLTDYSYIDSYPITVRFKYISSFDIEDDIFYFLDTTGSIYPMYTSNMSYTGENISVENGYCNATRGGFVVDGDKFWCIESTTDYLNYYYLNGTFIMRNQSMYGASSPIDVVVNDTALAISCTSLDKILVLNRDGYSSIYNISYLDPRYMQMTGPNITVQSNAIYSKYNSSAELVSNFSIYQSPEVGNIDGGTPFLMKYANNTFSFGTHKKWDEVSSSVGYHAGIISLCGGSDTECYIKLSHNLSNIITGTTFSSLSNVESLWYNGTHYYFGDTSSNVGYITDNLGNIVYASVANSSITDADGLYSNGTHIWIANDQTNSIIITDMLYNYLSSFVLPAANAAPSGVWVNDTHIFVTDSSDDMVYVYLHNSTASYSFSTTGACNPEGITGNGTHLFIADPCYDVISVVLLNGTYVYNFSVAEDYSASVIKDVYYDESTELLHTFNTYWDAVFVYNLTGALQYTLGIYNGGMYTGVNFMPLGYEDIVCFRSPTPNLQCINLTTGKTVFSVTITDLGTTFAINSLNYTHIAITSSSKDIVRFYELNMSNNSFVNISSFSLIADNGDSVNGFIEYNGYYYVYDTVDKLFYVYFTNGTYSYNFTFDGGDYSLSLSMMDNDTFAMPNSYGTYDIYDIVVSSSNSAPVISLEDVVSSTPGTLLTYVVNVTDDEGFADIDSVWLKCWGTGKSETDSDEWDHITNSSAYSENVNSTTNNYTFTYLISNKAINGTWNCKAFCNDTAGETANDTDTFDMNTRAGIILNETDFTITGNPGDTDVAFVNPFVEITHDGNIDMNVSILGTNLVNGTDVIAVGNITYDATSLPGTALTVGDAVTEDTWGRGTYPTASTINRFFWMDYPLPSAAVVYLGNISFSGSAS